MFIGADEAELLKYGGPRGISKPGPERKLGVIRESGKDNEGEYRCPDAMDHSILEGVVLTQGNKEVARRQQTKCLRITKGGVVEGQTPDARLEFRQARLPGDTLIQDP